MNAVEKREIVEFVKAELMKEMKGTIIREDTQSVLQEPRNKWFRGDRDYTEGIMFKVFGTYVYWTVWDLIRKLTCYICGQRYVRHLSGNEKANEVAEKLCQFVYDLRKEYMEEQP